MAIVLIGPGLYDTEHITYLECTTGNHNKFYEITWKKCFDEYGTANGYRITTNHGRIGSSPRKGVSHLSYGYYSSADELNRLIDSKSAKGYILVEEGPVGGTKTKSKAADPKGKLADKKKGKKSTHRFANLEF